jgi:hypothetical protein
MDGGLENKWLIDSGCSRHMTGDKKWFTTYAIFVEFVSLGDPSRRMLMMVRECTSTCYVLVWIVVVPASDLNDLFMECVTMFITQSQG